MNKKIIIPTSSCVYCIFNNGIIKKKNFFSFNKLI